MEARRRGERGARRSGKRASPEARPDGPAPARDEPRAPNPPTRGRGRGARRRGGAGGVRQAPGTATTAARGAAGRGHRAVAVEGRGRRRGPGPGDPGPTRRPQQPPAAGRAPAPAPARAPVRGRTRRGWPIPRPARNAAVRGARAARHGGRAATGPRGAARAPRESATSDGKEEEETGCVLWRRPARAPECGAARAPRGASGAEEKRGGGGGVPPHRTRVGRQGGHAGSHRQGPSRHEGGPAATQDADWLFCVCVSHVLLKKKKKLPFFSLLPLEGAKRHTQPRGELGTHTHPGQRSRRRGASPSPHAATPTPTHPRETRAARRRARRGRPRRGSPQRRRGGRGVSKPARPGAVPRRPHTPGAESDPPWGASAATQEGKPHAKTGGGGKACDGRAWERRPRGLEEGPGTRAGHRENARGSHRHTQGRPRERPGRRPVPPLFEPQPRASFATARPRRRVAFAPRRRDDARHTQGLSARPSVHPPFTSRPGPRSGNPPHAPGGAGPLGRRG